MAARSGRRGGVWRVAIAAGAVLAASGCGAPPAAEPGAGATERVAPPAAEGGPAPATAAPATCFDPFTPSATATTTDTATATATATATTIPAATTAAATTDTAIDTATDTATATATGIDTAPDTPDTPATPAPTTTPADSGGEPPAPSPLPASVQFSYGDDPAQVLDVYAAGPSTGVLVWVHGGAWVGGDRDPAAVPRAVLDMVGTGWGLAVVGYRPLDRAGIAGQVADIATALVAIDTRRAQLGLTSATPLVLVGHSAGGHLALLAALAPEVFAPVGVAPVAVGGVIALAAPTAFAQLVETSTLCRSVADLDRIAEQALACAPAEASSCREASQRLAPLAYWDEDDPPVLFVYGRRDDVVDVSFTGRANVALRRVGDDDSRVLILDDDHGLSSLTAEHLAGFLGPIVG